MLDAARQALLDAGLLSPDDPPPHFSVRMSGNIGLLFYLENGEFYLTKVGLSTRLDREYRGLSEAYRAMPSNVPEPIRLATYHRYQVLVIRGIPHEPLFPLRRADVGVLKEGIISFVASSSCAFRQSGRSESLERLHEALRNASRRVQWPDWEKYWERVRLFAERLTPVRQHGDLAVNNIGVHKGKLIFFDWEDFGEIDLPGFDLSMLLLSMNGFSFAGVLARLKGSSLEADIMARIGESLGMSPADFLSLFPAYAALYIQTKPRLGYPDAAVDRIVGALSEWIQLESHR